MAENLYLASHGNVGNNISEPAIMGPLEYMYIGNGTAVNGKCAVNCNNLGLFLLCSGILIFLLFVLKIPNILVTIRYASSN